MKIKTKNHLNQQKLYGQLFGKDDKFAKPGTMCGYLFLFSEKNKFSQKIIEEIN